MAEQRFFLKFSIEIRKFETVSSFQLLASLENSSVQMGENVLNLLGNVMVMMIAVIIQMNVTALVSKVLIPNCKYLK